MRLLSRLFWSSRPISWINTAFPFAAAYYFSGGSSIWILAIGSIFFLVPYNVLMYGVNDVFDYESDLRNPRKGGIEGALLEPRYHKATLWWAFGLSLPFAIALSFINLVATFWLWLVLFAVVAYSIKHLRFKERPVLDSLTSALHFVGPMVVGLSMAEVDFTKGFYPVAILSFMLWGMASHAFGAVQDVRADREAKIASIATAFGATVTTRLSLIAYAVAGALAFLLPGRFWQVGLASLPYLFVVGRYWNITDQDCERANSGWKKFIWLNFLSGAIVCATLIGPS